MMIGIVEEVELTMSMPPGACRKMVDELIKAYPGPMKCTTLMNKAGPYSEYPRRFTLFCISLAKANRALKRHGWTIARTGGTKNDLCRLSRL